MQKIYLIYIYILTGIYEKHSITNSCQNEMNMLIYEQPIPIAAKCRVAQSANALHAFTHTSAVPGSKSQRDMEAFRGK